MAGLKPSEEVQVAALSAAIVYGIWQLNAPALADVKASSPGGPASVNTHKSVKTAAWTAAVVGAGIAILARSPTVFIVTAALDIIESWKYYHANVSDAATGAVVAPGANATGQAAPTLNGS